MISSTENKKVIINDQTLAKIVCWIIEQVKAAGRNETKSITLSQLAKIIKNLLYTNRSDLDMQGISCKGDGQADLRGLEKFLRNIFSQIDKILTYIDESNQLCIIHSDNYRSDKKITDYVDQRREMALTGQLVKHRVKKAVGRLDAPYISEVKRTVDDILKSHGIVLSKGDNLKTVFQMLESSLVIEKEKD